MQFHALVVHPGKEQRLSIPKLHGFHLSVISLPPGKNGRTTLYVTVDGKPFALATIDTGAPGKPLQVATDLVFNAEQQVTFHAKGSSPVHCVGYIQSLEEDIAGFPGDSGDDFALPIESAKVPQGKAKRHRDDEELSEEYEEVQPRKKPGKLADVTQAGSDDSDDDSNDDADDSDDDADDSDDDADDSDDDADDSDDDADDSDDESEDSE